MVDVRNELKEQGYNVVVLGNGSTVIDQYPKQGVTLLNSERVILLTKKEGLVIPDLKNWSLKEVNAWSNFAKIEVVISGSGFVKTQSYPVGTAVVKDMTLTVELE